MNLDLTLTPQQAHRAAIIACRDAGHDAETCPDPAACVITYAKIMLAKHVEMTERQWAEEAARTGLQPFE